MPWNKPIIDEQPGPPFNLAEVQHFSLAAWDGEVHHRVNGAVSGDSLDSKNQNHWTGAT